MLPIILTFVSIEGRQFKYFTHTSSLRKAFFFFLKVAFTINLSYDFSKKWHSTFDCFKRTLTFYNLAIYYIITVLPL